MLVAQRALQRGLGQLVVFLFFYRQLGLAQPLGGFFFVLFFLFFQQMLVGDSDRHLRLHLQKLVLHVDDDLLDHLFRVLGLFDQVVKISSD